MSPDPNRSRAYAVIHLLGLAALFLLFIQALKMVQLVVSVLVISTLLAYLIAPAVELLARKGRSRVFAITVVYVLLGGVLAFSVAWVMPLASREFERLTSNLGYLAANLESIVTELLGRLQEAAPQPLKHLFDPSRFRMSDLVDQIERGGPGFVQGTLPGLFSGVRSVAGLLAGAVLVPLITFYILMDAGSYRRSFLALVPGSWRGPCDELLVRVDQMLGRYIRGQLIVCITIGASMALALTVMKVEYALLIGIFAGVVELIPYVGVAIGLIPAFLIALINDGFLWALAVVVVLEALHWLEGHIIVPAVIGHSVGLPPLTVLVALMMGAELGGIMGMFVAIPIAAIIRVLVVYYRERHGGDRLAPPWSERPFSGGPDPVEPVPIVPGPLPTELPLRLPAEGAGSSGGETCSPGEHGPT